MSRATTLNGGGGTIDTASSTTLTHSGDIGGTGGLIKSGTGTLMLGGTNSYAGGTTVSGGVLQGRTISLQGAIPTTPRSPSIRAHRHLCQRHGGSGSVIKAARAR